MTTQHDFTDVTNKHRAIYNAEERMADFWCFVEAEHPEKTGIIKPVIQQYSARLAAKINQQGF